MSAFAFRWETRPGARGAAMGLLLAALSVSCQRQEPSALAATFEDVSLTDQDGAALVAAALTDQVVLVNFMFTSCPVVCPRQTEALAQVRAALPSPIRERVRFISASVDPDNDTPRALQQFARAHHAAAHGWSFVRSDAEGTAKLTSRLAAFEPGTAPSPSAHGTSIYLFDRGGRLVQRYRGAPLDVSHLARELSLLDDLKPSGARLARN
ncbi:MAG: SCO family protein [Myxococcales bacterium]|nr:MAG: SCO family protein [Myxococcales bacterium]